MQLKLRLEVALRQFEIQSLINVAAMRMYPCVWARDCLSYALPGLRLGWLVTQDTQTMEKLRVWKDYTTICGSAPRCEAAERLRSERRSLRFCNFFAI